MLTHKSTVQVTRSYTRFLFFMTYWHRWTSLHLGVFYRDMMSLVWSTVPPSPGKYIYTTEAVLWGGGMGRSGERESERGKAYYWDNLIKYSYSKICRTKSKHFVTSSDHHFGKSFYTVFQHFKPEYCTVHHKPLYF